MRIGRVLARGWAWLLWQLSSISIGAKILGVGAVVAVLFGTVTIGCLESQMAVVFSRQLERVTLSTAQSLRARLERPLVIGDLHATRTILRETVASNTDIRYAFVLAPDHQIVAHTFDAGGVPPDLLKPSRAAPSSSGTLVVFRGPQGYLFDGAITVLDGSAGHIRVGLSDQGIMEEMGAMTRTVRWALAGSALLGVALALLLTVAIVRPIHRLEMTTREVANGNFTVRAETHGQDEIGLLAIAFNRMTSALQEQREEVRAKDAARQELIRRIISTQEDERERIARDLHDELGQSLSAVLLELQAAGRQPSQIDAFVERLERQIRDLIDEARRIAWGLRPSILTDHGLELALARHVQEVADSASLPIDFQYVGATRSEPRLPRDVETVLYRVAQEAVHNVVRHARATQASVLLFRRPAEIALLVEDDGVGFDRQQTRQDPPGTHLGLLGMEERISLIGGRIVFDCSAGMGTAVRASIPLRGNET